jgi:hypothetical protein
MFNAYERAAEENEGVDDQFKGTGKEGRRGRNQGGMREGRGRDEGGRGGVLTERHDPGLLPNPEEGDYTGGGRKKEGTRKGRREKRGRKEGRREGRREKPANFSQRKRNPRGSH